MEFKSAFFAVIVAGIVIAAVGVSVDSWNTKYQSGLTYDLASYDKVNDVSSYTGNYSKKISPNTPDQGSDAEASTYRGVYGIISNIFSPFRAVFGEGGMVDAVSERFGLPDYFRQGIIAMMIGAITFTLIAIIFRLTRGAA